MVWWMNKRKEGKCISGALVVVTSKFNNFVMMSVSQLYNSTTRNGKWNMKKQHIWRMGRIISSGRGNRIGYHQGLEFLSAAFMGSCF
jgi:hypothetical protein